MGKEIFSNQETRAQQCQVSSYVVRWPWDLTGYRCCGPPIISLSCNQPTRSLRCQAFCQSWGEGIASFSLYSFSGCNWTIADGKNWVCFLSANCHADIEWRAREEWESAFSHCVDCNIFQDPAKEARSEPTRWPPGCGQKTQDCRHRLVCFLLSVMARFHRGLFLSWLKTKGSGETVGQSTFWKSDIWEPADLKSQRLLANVWYISAIQTRSWLIRKCGGPWRKASNHKCFTSKICRFFFRYTLLFSTVWNNGMTGLFAPPNSDYTHLL